MADATDSALPRLPPFQAGMSIGLLGGSFDPPHEGHRRVSLIGLNTLGLDQVWWLVSPHNPLKPNAPSQDLARRIANAEAVARHPRIKVTGIEAALGTTYTAETLRHLEPRMRGVDLVWMMGADNLHQFSQWRDWQDIAASVPIAVFNRPGWALPALASPAAIALRSARLPLALARALPHAEPPAWIFLPNPHIPLSSTALRAVRPAAAKSPS